MSSVVKKQQVIVIVAETYPPDMNGAAQSAYRLAQQLTKRGHQVHIFTHCSDSRPSHQEQRPEGRTYRFRSRRLITHPTFRACLSLEVRAEVVAALERLRPDAIHVQSYYMLSKIALKEASRRGIRLVATNHLMPDNVEPFLPFPRWFLWLWKKCSWWNMGRHMSRADIVTAPTPAAAQVMERHTKLRGILPVSNGVDAAAYQTRPGEAGPALSDPPVILFVGRLAEEKHIDVLIRAVARVPGDLDVRLEIVGQGECRAELERLAVQCGVKKRVRFWGELDDEQLRSAYLRATVFVMPGTAELQSMASLEAASAGAVLIVADALALPHLVHSGVNGYLFEPGNSDQLAEELAAVLRASQEQRQAMQRASRELASRHDLQRTIDTFEQLYSGEDLSPAVTFPRWGKERLSPVPNERVR